MAESQTKMVPNVKKLAALLSGHLRLLNATVRASEVTDAGVVLALVISGESSCELKELLPYHKLPDRPITVSVRELARAPNSIGDRVLTEVNRFLAGGVEPTKKRKGAKTVVDGKKERGKSCVPQSDGVVVSLDIGVLERLLQGCRKEDGSKLGNVLVPLAVRIPRMGYSSETEVTSYELGELFSGFDLLHFWRQSLELWREEVPSLSDPAADQSEPSQEPAAF